MAGTCGAALAGEDSVDAAIREVKEESGFDVNLMDTEIAPPIELARVQRIPSPFCLLHEGIGAEENFFDFIYIAETKETIPHPDNNESKEFKWFTYEEIKNSNNKSNIALLVSILSFFVGLTKINFNI